MPKPFAWSWSKLKNYRDCPKRHYHCDVAREFKEDEGPDTAIGWGKLVHDSLANRIKQGRPLPTNLSQYERYAQPFDAVKQYTKVELELAMDVGMQKAAWFGDNTWFRAKVDVLIYVPETRRAAAFDWKTGNRVKPDFEQLGLTAQTIFANYPDVEVVQTSFEWLGHDMNTPGEYTRESLLPMWARLLPEVKVMEEAHRTMTYPPKPSYLCSRWCPVTICPHHGKSYR